MEDPGVGDSFTNVPATRIHFVVRDEANG
jgi:hypothetical protein